MKNDSIIVFWKTGDKFNAEEIVLPYVLNSITRKWWKEVTLIIWGSASKLLAEDEELQTAVKELKKNGVILESCLACSERLGAVEKFESLGIDVKYMGEPLTDYIKSGKHVITI